MSVTSGHHGRLTVKIDSADLELHRLADLVETFYAHKYFAHISSLTVEPETVISSAVIDKLLVFPGMSWLLKLHVCMPPFVYWASDMRNTIYLFETLALTVEANRIPYFLKLPALRYLVLDRVPSKQGPSGFQDTHSFEEPLLEFFTLRRSRGKPLLQFTAIPCDRTVELTSRVEKFLGNPDPGDVFRGGADCGREETAG